MDRYSGPSAEVLSLLAAREQWEADQTAIAEYERWYLNKLLAEQDAEGIAEQ